MEISARLHRPSTDDRFDITPNVIYHDDDDGLVGVESRSQFLRRMARDL